MKGLISNYSKKNKLFKVNNFNRKYNLNVYKNIFKTINTKEKAYWLGFIAADGHVSRTSNALSFMLSVKDEDQLDKFIKFINGDFKAKSYVTGDFNTKKVYYCVNDKSISSSIKKLGIISPKSKTLKLLKFDKKEYDLSYLLGYYDGDGTQKQPLISSGSLLFLKQIKKKYCLNSKIKYNHSKLGSCYTLYIGVNLFRIMIKNYKDSMKRKRDCHMFKSQKDLCSCNNLKSKISLNCKKCQIRKEIKEINLKSVLDQLKNEIPLYKIAKKYNLSDNGLRQKLIKLKKIKFYKNSYKNKENSRKKIIKMFINNKKVSFISKKVKLSPNRVNEIIRNYKIKHYNYKPIKNQRKIKYEKILLDFRKTKKTSVTAKNLGIHVTTVRKALRKLNH